jgi:hypothetical protein
MLSEQEIINNAMSYKKNGIRQLNLDKNDEMYLWFYSVWSHMEKALLPHIREQRENLIEFYPSCFLFGEPASHRQGIADNPLSAPGSGTYASGCICFTNQNIYFVALQAVTQKYPLFKSGPTGLSRAFLERIFGKGNDREAYPGDKTWAVDYPSVLGAQITKPEGKGAEIIYIQTASVDWKIYDDQDLLAEMLTIIKMGLNGKLSRI